MPEGVLFRHGKVAGRRLHQASKSLRHILLVIVISDAFFVKTAKPHRLGIEGAPSALQVGELLQRSSYADNL